MSKKEKKESFFWTSYSDLMTSMFFVMLLLFVLAVALLHRKVVEIGKERDATAEQLDKIKRLEESIKQIDTAYFEYNDEYKRHTLKKISVSFQKLSSNIRDIDPIDLHRLKDAGVSIVNFMNNQKRS